MPAESESAQIAAEIDRVFTTQMGGRASLDEVFRELTGHLPEHLLNHMVAQGLKTAIRGYFRRKSVDGLPQAPQVSADGRHVQLDLLTVDDHRYVAQQFLQRSKANRGQAEKVADRCLVVHGQAIDLDEVAAEVAAS